MVELNQVETQSVEPPVPWKSNLSSYSSKADTSSRYSSRDDVGSDGKAAPRFGSLSTPSTYRPSYSVVSGSYRSVPIKKEPPVPTYTSRYSTSTTSTKDSKEQDKDSPTIKKTPSRYDSKESISKYGSKDVPSSISTTSKYSSSKEVPSKYGSTKDLGSLSTSKYGSSKESSSKYGSHKELPTTKYGSTKDISSSASDPKSSRYNSLSSGRPKKDEGPPITYNTRYSSKTTGTKDRSRDPSPAITDNKRGSTENKRTPITLSGVRSRDPSPAAESKISIITARIRSRDPSPVSTDNKLSVFNSKIKSRDPSPIDSKRSSSVVSRIRSRDPSPAIDSRLGTYSSLRARSRDPSPVDTGSSYLRRSSRDPSPADSQRDRFGSTNNGYSSSYRPYSRSNTTGTYTSPKYGSNTSIPRSAAVDKALSYLSASESRSRSASVSRSSSQVEKVEKKEKVQKIEEPKIPPKKVEEIAIIETEKAVVESSTEETDEESSEESEPPIMVELVVCTRGTSPTPPSSSNFLRARRADLAKTIEKTVKRPQKRPPSVDKEIQSDRGDDSTRYLRYTGSRSSLQPWSSYLDSKYSSPTYSRYGSSSSPRYSRDSTSRSDKDRSESKSQTTDSEKKDEKPKEKSLSRSGSLIRSGSNKNLSVKSSTPKLEKSKSSPNESKSKSPPKSSSSSKPKSPDNSKSLPPMAPKAESPTKSTSSSGCLKWTNKDFRKSALNMGTSDRPRKVRTNSGTDTDIPNESSKTNSSLRSERSPSAGSEASNSSTTSSLEEDSKLNKTKASSRTSLLASSADELPMDKPTQSPNSLKLTESSRNDEAKSFLIRALGPVTNFFKSRSHESSDNKNWLDTNSATSISESLQQDTEPLRDLNSHNETDMRYDTNQNQPIDKALDMKYKLRHIDSGDRAWWLNSSEDLTGSSHREEKTTSTNHETSPRIVNNMSEKKCPEIVRINLNRIESGSEKSWWGGANSNEGSENTKSENHENKTKTSSVPSGEKSWWLSSPEQESSSKSNLNSVSNSDKNKYSVKPAKSGERAWWMLDDAAIRKQQEKGNGNSDSDSEEIIEAENKTNSKVNTDFEIPTTLGRRRSPEGVEDTSGRLSPYDNILTPQSNNKSKSKALTLFISRHTNIDEILGATQNFSMDSLSPLLIHPDQVRIHDSTSQMAVIQRAVDDRDELDFTITSHQTKPILDDAALQVYKDGDYGAYLDLESSLAEQSEEIEGLHSSRKNSLVVRTQLSVRVHAIIEKLLTSEGRELRRALFSLKQIFQEDKDLVHGFVALGGLNCLVRVGSGADQNYQNYILRALGQVMLYVDGMNGVMKHGPTIQWLYSLIASKYRLVVKTALKLLLVFVEYVENNCYLLVNAIHAVDTARGAQPWTNIMKLLKDYENADTELLIYATSLINKTLSGLSDQDSFYDESDYLEQQGMESVVQRYMSRPGTDLDLLDQLQLYEAVLKFEDGESDGIRIPDTSIRKTLRYRANGTDSTERRKSRRHSTGTAPLTPPPMPPTPQGYNSSTQQTLDEDSSSSQNSSTELNGVLKECRDKTPRDGAGVTPGLRRRRERAERQKSFIREQQEAAAAGLRPTFAPEETNGHVESDNEEKKLLLQLKRDHTVKDLTQKLSNLPMSPQEDKPQKLIEDMTGLISKAKEGLAKSKSKGEISRSPSVDQEIKKPAEPKKSENELHWEELIKNITRPLKLCDLDFTDLSPDDEKDVLAPRGLGGMVPPPPPPIGMPPPMSGIIPPPINMMPPPCKPCPPPMYNPLLNGSMNTNGEINGSTIKKNKKTVKLFWKEVREDMIPVSVGRTVWDELPETQVDTQKLEHLFESRAKDLMTKKQQELNKNKEIIVLDHKRSNAINIAMTKLPPPRAIKAAILKMDATVVTREGIDKLLNMLPTDEERGKIQEAQMLNPELPLGSAENFLLTLSSISELGARLKLWAFKLDFENIEKEIAEPLMDLKQGLELLKANKTFKCILSTLLSIGIFLNGAPVKGFQVEYLAKVPEVKDTVHKHSLLHHLCHMVMETSTDTTDLYSEIGPITRASKSDFGELAHNIVYLETECKASWDRLKLISKHDCPPQLKQKMVDFLADCAERIIILDIVHRRVVNRYRKFLLWLGIPLHRVPESRPNEFCRIISEFALEYRTTRERVHQQIEKKANHRERNKTRGKMIIDVGKFKSQEDNADAELRQLLGTPNTGTNTPDTCGTFTWRRRRAENLRTTGGIINRDESFTDGDDEILESLVKTATKTAGPRPTPRERKRTRHADRKSLKRSRTREGFTIEPNGATPEL